MSLIALITQSVAGLYHAPLCDARMSGMRLSVFGFRYIGTPGESDGNVKLGFVRRVCEQAGGATVNG
jgi:hypothetical protein